MSYRKKGGEEKGDTEKEAVPQHECVSHVGTEKELAIKVGELQLRMQRIYIKLLLLLAALCLVLEQNQQEKIHSTSM